MQAIKIGQHECFTHPSVWEVLNSPGFESCRNETVEWSPFGNTCVAAEIMVVVLMII
jgi:hypothetical protein